MTHVMRAANQETLSAHIERLSKEVASPASATKNTNNDNRIALDLCRALLLRRAPGDADVAVAVLGPAARRDKAAAELVALYVLGVGPFSHTECTAFSADEGALDRATVDPLLYRHGFRYRLSDAVFASACGIGLQGSQLAPHDRDDYPAAVVIDGGIGTGLLAHLQRSFIGPSRGVVVPPGKRAECPTFWDAHGYSDVRVAAFFSYFVEVPSGSARPRRHPSRRERLQAVSSIAVESDHKPGTATIMDHKPGTATIMGQLSSVLIDLAKRHFPAVDVSDVTLVEWWAHKRPHGASHQLHFDSAAEGRGTVINPVTTAIVYLQCGEPELVEPSHPADHHSHSHVLPRCAASSIETVTMKGNPMRSSNVPPGAVVSDSGGNDNGDRSHVGALPQESPSSKKSKKLRLERSFCEDLSVQHEGASGPARASTFGGPTIVTGLTFGSSSFSAANKGLAILPRVGRVAFFSGNLLHCVLPGSGTSPVDGDDCRRITLMCALWNSKDAPTVRDRGREDPWPHAGMAYCPSVERPSPSSPIANPRRTQSACPVELRDVHSQWVRQQLIEDSSVGALRREAANCPSTTVETIYLPTVWQDIPVAAGVNTATVKKRKPSSARPVATLRRMPPYSLCFQP